MSGIDVSYVVPAFDAARTLDAAVRSALEQEDVSVEVIVVDDASRDDTAARAVRLAREDARVRLVRLPENRGPSAARNAAIAAASGRFLGVLDADDTLEPGRTRRLVDLATLTEADVVADDLLRLDESGAALSRALPAGPSPYAFVVHPADYCRENIPMQGGFGTGYLKPLFAARMLAAAGIRYDESVRIGEDFLVCLDALLAGARYVVSSEPGYRYSARAGSLSHRIAAARLGELEAGFDRVAARHAGALADPGVGEACGDYLRGLRRARDFLAVVEAAKRGRVLSAAARTARTPGVWPLVLRYGREAIANRLAPRSRAGARVATRPAPTATNKV